MLSSRCRADNKGEGGIFSLFALLRKSKRWVYILAIIGGSTLLADGIITPSITVVSSIEGLQLINPAIQVVPIVLVIITLLFAFQQFGADYIGKFFGPVMFLWFLMLGVLGATEIHEQLLVFKAFNPYYAIHLLTHYPGKYFIARCGISLYHGGRGTLYRPWSLRLKNIRVSWTYVKICLILNYLGQGAWLLSHHTSTTAAIPNPFYSIMPGWFLPFGIALATSAAIIASQALISGSYTLISEAISLNFWPRIKINYPTQHKGQMYIASINWFLWISCIGVVIGFRESDNMEAAYGLSITITMMITTFLMTSYLSMKRVPKPIIALFFGTYLCD